MHLMSFETLIDFKRKIHMYEGQWNLFIANLPKLIQLGHIRALKFKSLRLLVSQKSKFGYLCIILINV